MTKIKELFSPMENSIKITAKPHYVQEKSDPVRSYYYFAYHITDGQGNTEDVHGPGVIGKQPKLAPGESFEYTSFCPLPTPMGFMEGAYHMVDEKGKEFDVEIKPFRLVAPQMLN